MRQHEFELEEVWLLHQVRHILRRGELHSENKLLIIFLYSCESRDRLIYIVVFFVVNHSQSYEVLDYKTVL